MDIVNEVHELLAIDLYVVDEDACFVVERTNSKCSKEDFYCGRRRRCHETENQGLPSSFFAYSLLTCVLKETFMFN